MNKYCSLPHWQFKSSAACLNQEELAIIATKLQVSPFLVQLMILRGIDTVENMDRYLKPSLRYLLPLDQWPHIEDGARYILKSIEQGEKIAMWGDYDVDGITAVALIKDFFSQRNIQIEHHIPDRLESGYGLDIQKIHSLADQDIKLLLTVDCGIANIREIQAAKSLGMKVVLTDHHLPGPRLPEADIIINPKLQGWPCSHLAGVGVAFLLMGALNRMLPGNPLDIRQYLDLVALGTIADVVPLDEQNRILVKNGLTVLSEAHRPGIQALKKISGFAPGETVGSNAIGFSLAPRINAAGRIGDPNLAVDLLLEKNSSKAMSIAHQLDQLNTDRKAEENRIVGEALLQVQTQLHLPGFVLHSEHWHPGIIGIVASRIVEKYHRPCIMLTKEKGLFKGSGRATAACDLYQALVTCQEHLYTFGGHKQAAGLKLEPFQLANFKKSFSQAIQKQLGDLLRKPVVEVDLELPFSKISSSLVEELRLLQPYGPGNPRPIFLSPPVWVKKYRFFSHNQHLELYLSDLKNGSHMRAVAWRQGEQWKNIPLQDQVIIITYFPKISKYQGLHQLELTIRDIFMQDQPGVMHPTSIAKEKNQ
jgi:single-stranded-DNA-specific exonuclease